VAKIRNSESISRMNMTRLLRLVLGLTLVGLLTPAGHAQWITQSFVVKPGWTAVYLNVDATYTTLDYLLGTDFSNPIDQVWLWKAPASTVQYLTSPSSPLTSGADWAQWSRPGVGAASTFNALIPNAAYLVHSAATTNYTWRIKGKPAAPSYTWTTTGLNFIGFPTPANNPPPFDTFLALSPAFAGAAEIYQYPGGELGPVNPSRVISLHGTKVTRGQAFWIRSGSVFNDYFGPFQVSVGGSGEVALGTAGGQYSVYLHNTSTSNLVICAQLLASESPPFGQPPTIVGTPPVLLRGNLNPTNLTYGYTDLSTGGTACWTLKPKGLPGSDITVVVGVNRPLLTGPPGALYAGILRFSDSLNLSQVDVPVSARASSGAGLWVGKASVTQVANYLKTYQRDSTNHLPVVSSNGNYVVSGINTNLGAVAQPFPLRLILHNDGTNVVLLQRVFYGLNGGSNLVVTTQESVLDPLQRDTARRLSTADFPWSGTNQTWSLSGRLSPGGTLAATVPLSYDDQASNPFLHTYHPDHDNLDATFQNKLPRGSESYDITRRITLNISPPGSDFASLTAAGQSLTGTYLETITLAGLGAATRDYNVSGVFGLNRISPIATLTQP
jgi:hypothetical protein